MSLKNIIVSFSSHYSRNIIIVMSATVMSQVLPLLFSPLLTQYYSSDDFGVFGTFTALATVLGSVATAKYHLAIMLPANKEDARALVYGSLLISLLYCIILFFVFAFFNEFILSLIGYEELQPWLLFIPVAVFFIAVTETLSFWSSRNLLFVKNATSKMANSSSFVALSMIGGLKLTFLAGPGWLILGRSFSYFFGSVVLCASNLTVTIDRNFRKKIKTTLATYVHFPKHLLIPSLLDTMSLQIMLLALGRYYTLQEVGFYNLTYIVSNAPMALIAGGFSQVFFQKLTLLSNDVGKAYSFFKRNALYLFTFNFFVACLFFFFGEFLFTLVYGADWSTSGTYASILAPALLFKSTVSPLSIAFTSFNKPRKAARWQILYFITSFSTILLCTMLAVDLITLLKIYVIHEIILYSVYYWLIIRLFKNK